MDNSRSLKLDMVAQACDTDIWRLRQNCCDLKASLCYKVKIMSQNPPKRTSKQTKGKPTANRNNRGKKETKQGVVVYTCNPTFGKWRQED